MGEIPNPAWIAIYSMRFKVCISRVNLFERFTDRGRSLRLPILYSRWESSINPAILAPGDRHGIAVDLARLLEYLQYYLSEVGVRATPNYAVTRSCPSSISSLHKSDYSQMLSIKFAVSASIASRAANPQSALPYSHEIHVPFTSIHFYLL